MSVQPSASQFGVQRQPNFENLRRTILRQGPPGPVPFIELLVDAGMMEAVLGEKFPPSLHRYIEEPVANISADELRDLMKAVNMCVRFHHEMGYDYVFLPSAITYPRHLMGLADTASLPNWSGGLRYWQDDSSGPIQNWKDFETYPWPRVEDFELRRLPVSQHHPA